MDVKQFVDGVIANPAAYARSVLLAAAVLAGVMVLFKVGPRLWRVIEEVFFTNWQLAMLGTAAIVLSLAGGWTTWDGMTNFTGESVLSLMFTFGIHGVMLIVAWLIGESFATGMSTVPRSGLARVTAPLIVVIGLSVVLLAVAAGLYQWRYGIAADRWIQGLLVAGAVFGGLGLLTVFARSDVVAPYAQALRIIAKNSMLWVMFLACMSTSVFFSFDSRFNVVFPKEQRERVSQLRAQNQVTGIIADIGDTITTQQLDQTEALFKSAGWLAYDKQLDKLATAAQGSTGEIEKYFNDQIEERNRSIKEQQERIASAQGGQAGIAGKKTTLTDELARLEGDRATLTGEYTATKTELDTRARAIDAKRVEAMAEDKGVEGSLKEGKGPIYHQRMDELEKMQGAYKIQEDRVKDAKKRLDAVDARVSQIKQELASIDGQLAKYKGEEETAAQRIKMAQDNAIGQDAEQHIDPGRVLPAFEKARAEFRQEPTAERLGIVQQRCSQLYNAMYSTEVTKPKVSGIDCDPKQASEAAASLFALQAGTNTFNANCVGGDKLAQHQSTDSLFAFATKCLADSGLPSKQTDELRGKISFAEMNRDDKAHRFVVTWNAFQDGNRLAYLALAIAIGIDSLIFMTGLFGANAVRSPLADVPSPKGRNSHQLEAIIENALLPDTFENARLTLDAMRAITNDAGFMAEVRPDQLDPHAAQRVRAVLNAGATINAVEYDPISDRYLVRAELFEFLSIVAKRSFEADKANVDLAELEKIVGVALLPDINQNAETVLHYMHPISEDRGFTAEIKLGEVAPADIRIVRNTLNAGATLDRVQRVGKDASHYWVHKDLYKTLARIRARSLVVPAGPRQIAAPSGQGHFNFGGSLTEHSKAIEHRPPADDEAEKARAVRSRFTAGLLEALNVDASLFEDLPGNALGAAFAANDAFNRARRSNPALDEQLARRDEEAQDSLQQAYNYIKSKLRPTDDWERQLLRDAYQDIEQHWAVLMLLPNGPYEMVVREIVEQLESDAGAGQLSIEQDELYNIARALVHAFTGNGRGSEMSWRRLEAGFNQAPLAAESRVALEQGRKSLN
jgi:hypothetical protein